MRGEDNEMTTVRALLFALQTVPEGDGPPSEVHICTYCGDVRNEIKKKEGHFIAVIGLPRHLFKFFPLGDT